MESNNAFPLPIGIKHPLNAKAASTYYNFLSSSYMIKRETFCIHLFDQELDVLPW